MCVMFFLCGVLPAGADLVWTPVDEYLSHCDYPDVIRSFIAAGEDGWVEAVNLPAELSAAGRFPNGTEFLIDVFCGTDDDRWAVIRNYRPPWSAEMFYPDECFVAMKDLVPGYDAVVFEEMHRDELQPFADEFDFCAQDSLEVRMTPDSAFVMYESEPGKLGGCREGDNFRNYHRIESVFIDENGDCWVPLKNVFTRPDGWTNIGKAEDE